MALIRRDIDKHPERLKGVLTGDMFAAEFFGNLPKKDEKNIVKSFADKNKDDALKTAPKVLTPPRALLCALLHGVRHRFTFIHAAMSLLAGVPRISSRAITIVSSIGLDYREV